MKWLVSSACIFSALIFTVYAAPASTGLQVSASASGGGLGGGLAGILSNIDLPGLLQGVNSFVKLVGAFCPPLSQVLDNVIQNVTSTAFRVFGRAILRSGGLGGGSGASTGGGGDSGQRVNVVLPTFPPDEDYDEEDEEDSTTTTVASVIAKLSQDVEEVSDAASIDDDDSANTIAKRHVRVLREAPAETVDDEESAADQEGAESAPEPGQDASDVDDQDRNKRYSPFGGGDAHTGGGAGSGNFLFDIIRLVAGSGATEESDEHDAGGVAELDVQKSADGYTEGIPGPITRLFVIANRGLANLVQDLILRLAQTSERLVNFKARLITALI